MRNSQYAIRSLPVLIAYCVLCIEHCNSGSSSFGRASAFQAEGGRFEPGLPLKRELKVESQKWKVLTKTLNIKLETLNLTSRCSSGVEHFLGKEEVTGSIPVNGSKKVEFGYTVLRKNKKKNKNNNKWKKERNIIKCNKS